MPSKQSAGLAKTHLLPWATALHASACDLEPLVNCGSHCTLPRPIRKTRAINCNFAVSSLMQRTIVLEATGLH